MVVGAREGTAVARRPAHIRGEHGDPAGDQRLEQRGEGGTFLRLGPTVEEQQGGIGAELALRAVQPAGQLQPVVRAQPVQYRADQPGP